MDLNERIARYLAVASPAVDGQKGSDQTFFIACTLVNGFELSESEALYWLKQFNVKCQPPWEEKDLIRKVKEAIKAEHKKPRGHLLNGSAVHSSTTRMLPPPPVIKPTIDPVSEIENFLNGFKCSENDLIASSPVDLGNPEHWREHGKFILCELFSKQDRVNIVTEYTPYTRKSDGVVKANPYGIGTTLLREEMLEYIDPALNKFTPSKAGAWLRINPMSGHGVTDKDVTGFRHALIEFDSVPIEMQICFLAHAPIPISAILTSGDKSVHAWVKMDCPDFAAYSAEVHLLRETLSRFGIDRSNKNPSRLSRLPGVRREIRQSGDGRQRLLYLNPNPEQKAIL